MVNYIYETVLGRMVIVKPVSNDKRADIVAAKQRGEPVVVIKKWFNVSDSTISRIWNKFKKTGSYEPVPYTWTQERYKA